MTGPGMSAEREYRYARYRRFRIRALSVLAATAAGAAGVWALRAGHPDTGGALWAVTAASGLLLSRPWFGGRDVERWSRGAEGERRSAAILAGLPGRKWVVRHDLRIPGSRANIDHVVIGPTGVWVVDTKTTRAPVRARWRRVYFGDRQLDTRSVRWEADVVSARLDRALEQGAEPGDGWRRGQLSGGRVAGSDDGARPADPDPADLGGLVRPLVAVHGHGLRRRGGRAGGVVVVPAERLARRIRRGRRRLARADVGRVSEALDRAFPPPGARGDRADTTSARRAVGATGDGRGRTLRAGRSYG